jgi:hypothetical protein
MSKKDTYVRYWVLMDIKKNDAYLKYFTSYFNWQQKNILHYNKTYTKYHLGAY